MAPFGLPASIRGTGRMVIGWCTLVGGTVEQAAQRLCGRRSIASFDRQARWHRLAAGRQRLGFQSRQPSPPEARILEGFHLCGDPRDERGDSKLDSQHHDQKQQADGKHLARGRRERGHSAVS